MVASFGNCLSKSLNLKGFLTAAQQFGFIDAAKMAEAIVKIAGNYLGEKDALDGIEKDMILDNWKINIPYSLYTGDITEEVK